MGRWGPGSGQGWDQGTETLFTLARHTGNRGDELAALIKLLITAAEPLSGRFNGSGKAAFDRFKAHSDEITADLKGGLNRVGTGQLGMEQAFAGGDHEMADEATRSMSAAHFDQAKFRTG
ncbi:hypothetical protein E1293_10845 [Actinomadura darangshiensis]|uniref:Uncharacterized protein n=1 Tax=Actinomadura darangshiensis TaxID=705336 RepID=A0A4R5BIK6_9ACTN|nr:hypothetical protein [Actinomadura darangshiensis]TDD85595.1 hypothetical protein E1293_10845 [Actinomadura darangshiensis]